MSTNETPAETTCAGFQAIILFKDHCNKINSCLHLLEKNVFLAFVLDYLQVKEDREVHKAIQKLEFYSKNLEMANLHQLQENGKEADRATENCVKEVKNSFKDVCFRLAQCYPKPQYQYVHGELPKEVLEVQQLFMNSLQKIVAEHLSYKKEEAALEEVPEEDNPLNVIIDQLNTKLDEKGSMIDKCTHEIQRLKMKMEELLKGVGDDAAQSCLKEAEIRQDDLQKDLHQLSVQLNKLCLKNRDKERQIQEETNIVLDETEYLLQCFNDFMEKEQADIEAREEELLANEVELMKTEELCAALEVEYTEVMERRRLAEKARQEEMRILQLKTKAAIIAQAWWRGYRVRKALKNRRKKDKKGKGKKTK